MYSDPPLSLYSDPRPLNPYDMSIEGEESGRTASTGIEAGRVGVAKAGMGMTNAADSSTMTSPLCSNKRCDSQGAGVDGCVAASQDQTRGGSTVVGTAGGEGAMVEDGCTPVHTAAASPLSTTAGSGEAGGGTNQGVATTGRGNEGIGTSNEAIKDAGIEEEEEEEGRLSSRHSNHDFHESLHTFRSESATMEPDEGVGPDQTTPMRVPGSFHSSPTSCLFSHEDEHLTASPNFGQPPPASMMEMLPVQKDASNHKQSGSNLVSGLVEASQDGGCVEEDVRPWEEEHSTLTQ